MITVHDCKLMKLPSAAGNGYDQIKVRNLDLPFDIARVYYSYDVPGGQERGGHAHKALKQLIVAAVGSFSLSLDDGSEKRRVTLDRTDCGLYIPGHIWTRVQDIAPGSVCMVLASQRYDESDYIRNYDQFLAFKRVQSRFESCGIKGQELEAIGRQLAELKAMCERLQQQSPSST